MVKDDYSLERMRDRMEIQDQLMRFSRGVDRKDWGLALSAYHDNAVDNHGIFNGSAADFVEFTRKRHESVLMSVHHLTHILIDFIGVDTALVESYLLGWQAVSPGGNDPIAAKREEEGQSNRPVEMIASCRYVDHFERRNGRWAIQERNVVYESGMTVISDIAGPDVRGTIELGRRDDQDISFKLRAKLLERTTRD